MNLRPLFRGLIYITLLLGIGATVQTIRNLNDLNNVAVPSPSNGQALVYNSAIGLWTNSTVASGSSLGVNGASVSAANLLNSADASFSVAGSNITASVLRSSTGTFAANGIVSTNSITDQSIGASKLVRTDGAGTLQDVTIGSGIAFDGTTLSGTGGSPAFTVDANKLIQADVTLLGPAGTNSFVIVGGSSVALTNGLILQKAYTQAKLATPHGIAKSAVNRYTIHLLPGTYDFGAGTYAIDSEFIDTIGISPNTGSEVYNLAIGVDYGDTVLKSSGNVITVTAPNVNDYTIQNLAAVTSTSGGRAFYTLNTTRSKEKIKNVIFHNSSGIANSSMSENTHYDGTYTDVRAWNSGSFGYRTSGGDVIASGMFVRCKAGDYSFAVALSDANGTASGTFIDCEADGVSFGRLAASGSFLRCRYVATVGTGGTMFASSGTRSGTFRDCLDLNGIWLSDSTRMLVGKTLGIQSGTNQRAGNAVLVGGTKAVANTTVTANTVVLWARKTAGGTLGNITYTLSAATSFTLTSDSGTDTSTISYFLIEVP